MIFDKFMQKNPLNVCGGGYGNLDLLKISLALLIVLRHIGQKFFCANTFWHVYIINTISTIGVTSFFIMSGFLLFKKTVNRERLRKQFLRILKLYGCWAVIYLPLNIYNYLKDGIRFPVALVDFVQKALFDGTFYHLWYLPSLIVAMYVVYVMKNRKFALMLLTTVLMIIGILTDTYGVSFPNLYYSIFLTTRNGFFMGSFLVAVGKCLADYESKIRNIRILKLILPVAIIVLYVEGILVSKIDSECIINITFTTVIAAIVLVAFMISLPQIEANKNARNISTVIYLCHPWIIFAVGSLEHFGIACNGWVKVVISMIMSICTAFLVVKMSNKFKIIRKFI